MRRHVLVTNDFPPKVGGIQSYLWELWRRLPEREALIHTTPYKNSVEFDSENLMKLSALKSQFCYLIHSFLKE